MKTISIISLLAVLALAATPRAEARDNTGAIVGGIVGGIIIGSILADDDDHDRRVSTSVTVGYDHRRDAAYGRWEWTTSRTWVPGYHERHRDSCGRRYTVWVPGHYAVVRERVWVADSCPPPRYSHHDRKRDSRDDDRRRHRY